jgi:XTP/dITP diphosphohydrolase
MERLKWGELVLASGNAGKLRELRQLLEPLGLTLRPQSDWDLEEAVEDADTFLENALIKARHAAVHTGLPALADDSGLVVPALGGRPGIHSARYGGEPRSDEANNRRLLAEMRDLSGAERGACFYCAMVLVQAPDDPAPLVATAAWWGRILDAPRGSGGFGYDPLFHPDGEVLAAAELPAERKNRLSHRGQASRALVKALSAVLAV